MKPGDIVFLSASVPTRQGWTRDAQPAEIEEAVIALARAVFARGGRLLFGGHPSISPLVAAVAGEYFPPDPQRAVRPVITFQSEHFRRHLPDDTWDLYRMGWASIEWTPEVIGGDEAEVRQASLALMRQWMLLGADTPPEILKKNALQPPRAMVAAGGMEGVCDEAVAFLRHRDTWAGPAPRIYVVSSGGGAASALARATKAGAIEPPLERLGYENWQLLLNSRRNGSLQVLEEMRPTAAGVHAAGSVRFQPYAAMMQWMLDRLE